MGLLKTVMVLTQGQTRYIHLDNLIGISRMVVNKLFFLCSPVSTGRKSGMAGILQHGWWQSCVQWRASHAGPVATLLLVFGVMAAAAQPIDFAVLMPAPDIKPAPELPRSAPLAQESVLHPARQALALRPIHDQTNPAYQQLQRIDEATSHLPHDPLGFPDWMASLRSGAITPRAGLTENASMNVLDLDVVMKNTKEMPNVMFPHRSHTLWLDCSNCHPAPFLPKAGVNPVSMGEIFRGRYCGMCHDRVAFISFFSCTRCHSVPQGPKLPSK